MGRDRGFALVPRRGPVAYEGPVDRRWKAMGITSERWAGGRGWGGRRVVVLAYPGADLLDVAGPWAVFDAFDQTPGKSEETAPGSRVEVVSTGGGSRMETPSRSWCGAERHGVAALQHPLRA